MPDPQAAALIAADDLDGLRRRVDELCAAGAWPEVSDVAAAVAVGSRRLWRVGLYAEHRVALDAPGEWAGPLVARAGAAFAFGPLTEVAASTHTWAELAPHLGSGPARALVAYERVLRGEDLRADRSIDTSLFDLPLRVESWEPAYPVATYEAWRGIFPTPAVTPLRIARLPEDPPPTAADLTGTAALAELTRPWVEDSNGRADAVAVEGDAADAIAALGVESALVAPVPAARALEIMAWAGASSGVHGRRRGMAAGRFAAWWTVAALSGLSDDWPVDPDDLADAAAQLDWFAWDLPQPSTGWTFRLAVVDATQGMAWAAMADDQRLD